MPKQYKMILVFQELAGMQKGIWRFQNFCIQRRRCVRELFVTSVK